MKRNAPDNPTPPNSAAKGPRPFSMSNGTASSSAGAARPVFMSKAQREALAKQREAEAAKQNAHEQAVREDATRALIQERRRVEDEAIQAYEREKRRAQERAEVEKEQVAEHESIERESMKPFKCPPGKYTKAERREFYSRGTATAEEIIKERRMERYLGHKKDDRRYKTTRDVDKARKLMEWDARDDTTIADSIVYGDDEELIAPAVLPLFGRGNLGGIDPSSVASSAAATASPGGRVAAAVAAVPGSSRIAKSVAESKYDVHWSRKDLAQMTARDWRIFKEDFCISTRGGNIPNPIRSWGESSIAEPVLHAIRDLGWLEPTPIQKAAIPIGLQFRDIIGVAETGSGKTGAFVVPMLAYISCMPVLDEKTQLDGPYALVMAPSRELILQIREEITRLAKYTRVRVVSLIGGESIEEQAVSLSHGCEVIVATPARLLDCIQSRFVVLNQCYYLVLDEADRMVAMGFEKQLNDVLEAMPATNLKSLDEDEAARQESEQVKLIFNAKATAGARAALEASKSQIYRTTIMFSATMPPAIERLARKYLRRPAQVVVGEVGQVTDNVDQRVIWTQTEQIKRQKLRELLHEVPPPIIIFLNQKKAVDTLVRNLIQEGWPRTIALHSSRTEEQRQNALKGFKEGRYDILVATDVAARGIDVSGVQLVVNYEMPKTIEDYTHRVGRTGRAGQIGIAASFLTPDDVDIMPDLRNVLTAANQDMPPELEFNPAAMPRDPMAFLKRKNTIIRAPGT